MYFNCWALHFTIIILGLFINYRKERYKNSSPLRTTIKIKVGKRSKNLVKFDSCL